MLDFGQYPAFGPTARVLADDTVRKAYLGRVDRAMEDALSLFPELTPRLPIAAGSLSGGQKQMVLIAQAIISTPSFMPERR